MDKNKVDLRTRQRTDEENKTIGSQIKKYRKALNMTQGALGRKVNRSDIAIRKYENGTVETPLKILKTLALHLNMPLINLLQDKEVTDLSQEEINALATKYKLPANEITTIQKPTYMDELDLDNYINIKNVKDQKGITRQVLLSPQEEKSRIALYNFMYENELIPDFWRMDMLDDIAKKMIPHLKIFIDEVEEEYKKRFN